MATGNSSKGQRAEVAERKPPVRLEAVLLLGNSSPHARPRLTKQSKFNTTMIKNFIQLINVTTKTRQLGDILEVHKPHVKTRAVDTSKVTREPLHGSSYLNISTESLPVRGGSLRTVLSKAMAEGRYGAKAPLFPDVARFIIKLGGINPALVGAGLSTRLGSEKLRQRNRNGRINRYLSWMYVRLLNTRAEPDRFWRIALSFIRQSDAYMLVMYHSIDKNFYRSQSYKSFRKLVEGVNSVRCRHRARGSVHEPTIAFPLTEDSTMLLSHYINYKRNFFEKAIRMPDGTVHQNGTLAHALQCALKTQGGVPFKWRPLGVPTLVWRVYLKMWLVPLNVYFPVSAFQHGFCPRRGTIEALNEYSRLIPRVRNLYEVDLAGFFPSIQPAVVSHQLGYSPSRQAAVKAGSPPRTPMGLLPAAITQYLNLMNSSRPKVPENMRQIPVPEIQHTMDSLGSLLMEVHKLCFRVGSDCSFTISSALGMTYKRKGIEPAEDTYTSACSYLEMTTPQPNHTVPPHALCEEAEAQSANAEKLYYDMMDVILGSTTDATVAKAEIHGDYIPPTIAHALLLLPEAWLPPRLRDLQRLPLLEVETSLTEADREYVSRGWEHFARNSQHMLTREHSPYIETGLPQGSPLSPFLSILILDKAYREARRLHPKVEWLFYADDGMFYSDDDEAFERFNREIDGLLAKYGIKLSREKSQMTKLAGKFLANRSKFLGHVRNHETGIWETETRLGRTLHYSPALMRLQSWLARVTIKGLKEQHELAKKEVHSKWGEKVLHLVDYLYGHWNVSVLYLFMFLMNEMQDWTPAKRMSFFVQGLHTIDPTLLAATKAFLETEDHSKRRLSAKETARSSDLDAKYAELGSQLDGIMSYLKESISAVNASSGTGTIGLYEGPFGGLLQSRMYGGSLGSPKITTPSGAQNFRLWCVPTSIGHVLRTKGGEGITFTNGSSYGMHEALRLARAIHKGHKIRLFTKGLIPVVRYNIEQSGYHIY